MDVRVDLNVSVETATGSDFRKGIYADGYVCCA